jgi:hypothetical protein
LKNSLSCVIFKERKNAIILRQLENWENYIKKIDRLSPLMLWLRLPLRARCTTLCDKVCQWLTVDRWFSPGPPVSPLNKTDRHDITVILLKVALNTIKTNKQIKCRHLPPQPYYLVSDYLGLFNWIINLSTCMFVYYETLLCFL